MTQETSVPSGRPTGFALSDHWLLVSDVDNTLLGQNEALLEFVEICESSDALTLALNSSRPCEDVQATLRELPVNVRPKAIIGAMGTEIEIDGVAVDEWTRQFAGWDRSPIDAVITALGFVAHPANLQTPFKVSYAVPESDQGRVEEAVRATGIPTRIISSGVSDFDILPPTAGKGTATVFLARRLGVSLDRLIVAGDSENDVQMFAAADKGIVVGNASEGLRRAVESENVYFARSECAAGLVEGLRYWNVPINEKTS